MRNLLILLGLALLGCAPPKPAPSHHAQMVIPISCIDKVVAGVKDKTHCEVLPGHPDLAQCKEIVVHFTCVRVEK